MTRTKQWLRLIRAFQALRSSTRQVRICLDCYFADESDFETLPVLFPHVERIGLIVPNHDAAAIYRHTLRSMGWEKVVPVLEGDKFNGAYDIVITRW
jgi:hypothetical protein